MFRLCRLCPCLPSFSFLMDFDWAMCRNDRFLSFWHIALSFSQVFPGPFSSFNIYLPAPSFIPSFRHPAFFRMRPPWLNSCNFLSTAHFFRTVARRKISTVKICASQAMRCDVMRYVASHNVCLWFIALCINQLRLSTHVRLWFPPAASVSLAVVSTVVSKAEYVRI